MTQVLIHLVNSRVEFPTKTPHEIATPKNRDYPGAAKLSLGVVNLGQIPPYPKSGYPNFTSRKEPAGVLNSSQAVT